MNTIKSAVILAAGFLLAAAGAIASAADLVMVPTAAQSGVSSVTRAQVKQELQQAIANDEIRHGDLADFQSLVEPFVQRNALADNRAKSTDVAAKSAAETQAQSNQSGAASGVSSGR